MITTLTADRQPDTSGSSTFTLRPILDVAAELGVNTDRVLPLGKVKAKIDLAPSNVATKTGSLILVSAITPTKAGEGKTTVSVGLADGLRRLGQRTALCLREPSLGPVFGIKGGGTGGGNAQVEPANDINLHFTGDLHAVGAAHNLLAAMIDNDLHFGGASGLTPERVTWSRAVDVNDRALRNVVVGVGGKAERSSRFDITAASEIMAVMALASSIHDLRLRLRRIVVGTRTDGSSVTASDLGAVEAMVALLQDALKPNLVQTREGTPAFVHLGPFGNIAHGCSSVVATNMALEHADLVITEAGFGFELGGEKFLDLKCRQAGVWPRAVVLVATVQALAAHGNGVLEDGLGHLDRQMANIGQFGLPVLVAINVFPTDTEEQLQAIEEYAARFGVVAARITSFADGGAGGEALAARLLDLLDTAPVSSPQYLYELDNDLVTKLTKVAQKVYGAAAVELSDEAQADLAILRAAGQDGLPVCIAKTHLSFSQNPKDGGLAHGFVLRVQELRVSAGAGFVVALMGNIVTMPALPREPAALKVQVLADGSVKGLMQAD